MNFLWSLIVGGIIGWIAGLIMGRDIPAVSSVTSLLVLSVLGLVDFCSDLGDRKWEDSSSCLL